VLNEDDIGFKLPSSNSAKRQRLEAIRTAQDFIKSSVASSTEANYDSNLKTALGILAASEALGYPKIDSILPFKTAEQAQIAFSILSREDRYISLLQGQVSHPLRFCRVPAF